MYVYTQIHIYMYMIKIHKKCYKKHQRGKERESHTQTHRKINNSLISMNMTYHNIRIVQIYFCIFFLNCHCCCCCSFCCWVLLNMHACMHVLVLYFSFIRHVCDTWYAFALNKWINECTYMCVRVCVCFQYLGINEYW